MDYWNGRNTGLDYRTVLFSFLDKFLNFSRSLLFMIYKYLGTMDDCIVIYIMTTVAVFS